MDFEIGKRYICVKQIKKTGTQYNSNKADAQNYGHVNIEEDERLDRRTDWTIQRQSTYTRADG